MTALLNYLDVAVRSRMYRFRVDLQIHLFQGANYGILDVLRKMKTKGLDAIAVLSYNWNKKTFFFPLAKDEISRAKEKYEIEESYGYLCFIDKENRKRLYIFLGEEVAPVNQKWHFLCIGATDIRSSFASDREKDVIEEVLSKGGLLIFDHPFADPQRKFKDITSERAMEITRICNEYKQNIALEWNSYCLPWVRDLLPGNYSNVNLKAEAYSRELEVPLVPTTDLHAPDKRLLKAMGKSFIEIPITDMNFNDLLVSLKKNVLTFNFRAVKKYVSFCHFAEAFGFPLMKEIIAGR